MYQRILAFALALFTVFSSFMGGWIRLKDVKPAEGDFTPVVRFAALSDVHINSLGDTQCQRMAKAVKSAYAIARTDNKHGTLDGIIFAGDITEIGTEVQYLSFQSVLNANLREETRPMVIIAKSHDCNTMGKDALTFWENLSGLKTDYHDVIEGFHFIGISTTHDKSTEVKYTDEQLDWFREQLALAAADDPLKPIFVAHHEHVNDTVYGSRRAFGERWGTPEFYDILADYPQAVDFSGHSHYPLNDPRSIWQGDFTALGTSSLYYYEFTVDDVATFHPKNHRNASQMWIVEVDAANRVRLRGYDLIGEAFVCEYLIEKPSDKASFAYTPEKMEAASSPPVFADNAQATVECGVDGGYNVTVPAARSTDGKIIFIYRVYVYDASGNPAGDFWELSGYYFTPPPESVEVKIDNLPEGDYTLKIVAENAYGQQSEPLIMTLNV